MRAEAGSVRQAGRMAPRLAAAAVLLLVLGGGLVLARLAPHQVAALYSRAGQTAQELGAAGWLLAALVQLLVAMSGLVPASIGAFTTGATFGLAGGFLISASATLAGSMLAFFLARGLFRPLVTRALARHPKVVRLDDAVARDGWRVVALMRVSPVMPFALTSYALGLTSIDTRQYLLGTLAAMPALFGYVAMGHLSAAGVGSLLARDFNPVRLAIMALALAGTVLLTVKLTRMIQLALRDPGGVRSS